MKTLLVYLLLLTTTACISGTVKPGYVEEGKKTEHEWESTVAVKYAEDVVSSKDCLPICADCS